MIKKNEKIRNDYEIVFSDDPSFKKNKIENETVEIIPNKIKLTIRLEKNQRGGKIVTVILGMPQNATYFLELTKKLKNHCGSGGTFKDNRIEIQGDHVERIKPYLLKIGFKI